MAPADQRPTGHVPQTFGLAGMRARESGSGGPANLADILERVLDKGIVIAGDIQVNLLDIELLTIRIRLLIASVDRAREMGINWWESDPRLSTSAKQLEEQNRELRGRLDRLERLLQNGGGAPGERVIETVSETTTLSESDEHGADETVTETTTVSESREQGGDESGR